MPEPRWTNVHRSTNVHKDPGNWLGFWTDDSNEVFIWSKVVTVLVVSLAVEIVDSSDPHVMFKYCFDL